MSALFLS